MSEQDTTNTIPATINVAGIIRSDERFSAVVGIIKDGLPLERMIRYHQQRLLFISQEMRVKP